MTSKNKKALHNFIKSLSIFMLIFCAFIIQNFTPTLGSGNRPTCDASGNISCANGTPTCSTGTAICGSKLGLMGAQAGPGCSRRGGFFPGEAACISSSTSSTSSSGIICKPPCELICHPCRHDCPCRCVCPTSSSSSSSGIICRPPCEFICPPCPIGFNCPCRCICPTSSSSGSCTKRCSFPCYGFDPSLCRCLPLGCDGRNSLVTPTSTSFSSSSSSSSGTTSNGNSNSLPFCINNEVRCNNGNPKCDFNNIAICGSELGLGAELAGAGCTDSGKTFFEGGTAYCTNSFKEVSLKIDCVKKNICPKNRKRTEPCREDKTSCKCICQFKTRNKKYTPSCNKADNPVCPGKLTSVCSNPKNTPVCKNGKILCEDIDIGQIDLTDEIICK